MGRATFTRSSFAAATRAYVPPGRATRDAEREARIKGCLNPEVDPKGYAGNRYMVRPSRVRMEELPNGLFEATDGTPLPVETLLDTTGSMNDNIDKALKSLADSYEWCDRIAGAYHLHMCTGTFGDVLTDQFPYCRSQFEMVADKMVVQLKNMVADNNGGGNGGEHPQYGLFAAAYLTDFYINKIGLKGYHFLVSDEPARDEIEMSWLRYIFGDDVIRIVNENGFELDPKHLPTVKDVVQGELLKRTHAFFLQVGDGHRYGCNEYWTDVYGPDRVVVLPRVELLPHVQAVLIGLTEGNLTLSDTDQFLTMFGVNAQDRKAIVRSVSNIPVDAQPEPIDGKRRPMKGDLFYKKDDIWPIEGTGESLFALRNEAAPAGPNWL